MKRFIVAGLFAAVAAYAAPAISADPAFVVTRLVISQKVVDREPAGIAESFPASVEKVYCFLEVSDVKEDTGVLFVWYHQGREMARVEVPLGKSGRWRTYSSKLLARRTGQWKVELQDLEGKVLGTAAFEVVPD